ncbi:MAG: DUF4304 domain-containing protein [Planctomycetes bacterium]|nr:DUF4304 domain-containing protein [Planctomycetota bacterium]
MIASSTFSKLLKECIKPLLKDNGFSQKGNTFIVQKSDNWGLINFQKSRKSSASEMAFTVNIGITSSRLLNYSSLEIQKPSIDQCHLRQRLGFLLQERCDQWWTINAETKVSDICEEIKGYISNYALPYIERYLTDETLRDLWLSGQSPGLTEIECLLNLTILLKEIGPIEILNQEVANLRFLSRNKPIASTVDLHIKKLFEKE